MKCPSCEHEAPQEAFGNPLRCPDCGIFYEKAVELKLKAPPQVVQQVSQAPYFGPGFRPCGHCMQKIGDKQKRCHHCGKDNAVSASVFGIFLLIIGGMFVFAMILKGVFLAK